MNTHAATILAHLAPGLMLNVAIAFLLLLEQEPEHYTSRRCGMHSNLYRRSTQNNGDTRQVSESTIQNKVSRVPTETDGRNHHVSFD